MRRQGLALAMILATAGCTTSASLGRVITPEYEAMLRDRSSLGELMVPVQTGHRSPVEGRIVRVTKDDVLLDMPDGEVTVSKWTIDEVRTRNRSRGALEGLLFGVLAGGAVGLTLTEAIAIVGCVGIGTDNPCGPDYRIALGSAVVGGLVGAVIGAVRGHTTRYLFHPRLDEGGAAAGDATGR